MALPNVKISFRETVFIDTSALFALIADDDFLHKSAKLVMAKLTEKKARLVTTESVLFELANGLSSVQFRSTTAQFIARILTNDDIEIEWSSRNLFDRASELYENRPDKEWSLTDCASFVVMNDRNISFAFTSDKHFEQAGFIKLLEI